jgi:hypothetical protein
MTAMPVNATPDEPIRDMKTARPIINVRKKQ